MQEKIAQLAKVLAESNLKNAFGVSGSGSSLRFITELEDRGARYFSASHEASAALMAGAAARASGQLSISISIKGPGLANMLPGIISNHYEGIPSLSISEAYGVEAPSYRMHKRLNHFSLLSSVVKAYSSLSDGTENWLKLLKRAQREVPGPVHMDLCQTKGEETFSEDENSHNPLDTEAAHQQFLSLLQKSKQPILIVGSLASRRKWGAKLSELNIPIFTTVSAKGVLDETLPHSAGVFTGAGRELALERQIFNKADLVVGLGLRNTEVLQPNSFNQPLVIYDEVDSGLTDGFLAEAKLIEASPDLLGSIFSELKRKSWGTDQLECLKSKLNANLLDVDWLPAICFDVLNHLEHEHALVLDTGSFCTIGEHVWMANPQRYFMGSSNGRYMGASIPSAIGLATSRPGLPVFCAVGDGGIRMYPAEIKMAVGEELPVCFILMTDGLYGSIACVSQAQPMSSRAVSLYQPTWFRAVEAMDCEAYQVNSADSFSKVIHSWERKKPLFIEAVFDPETYAQMTRRLR